MAEQAILNGVRRWVRVRNGLRAAAVTAVALLGAMAAARLWGTWVPAGVWLAVPAAWIGGLVRPVRWERAFLDAGRRWGVGERVAALDAAVRHSSPVFGEALAQEIRSGQPQARRIAVGKTEYCLGLCVVALAVAVGFVGPLDRSPGLPPAAASDATLDGLVADPDGAGDDAGVRPAEALSPFPADAPGVSGYTPYQDLLASVLGLDDVVGDLFGEELAARIAAEEGLLRRLAERLAESAPGGISPAERERLAPLARELSRRDLGQRVEDLLGEGGEGAAREAAEAVGAVLDAAERVGGAGEPDPGARAVAAGPATDVEGNDPWEGEGPFADLFDMNGMERGEPPGEGGIARNVPGATEGDPLAPGLQGDWDMGGVEREAFGVEGDEGGMRAYLVRGVPGEPDAPGDVPSDRMVEQGVEVVVRMRGLPPELRDLVRRYFELIGGVP